MLIYLLNLIAYLFMITMNFLANYLPLNGKTTGEISNQLQVIFTPAGYVFAIWGLIYLLTGVWVISQFVIGRKTSIYKRSFPWFLISCILNGLWIYLWHYEQFILSIFVIAFLLISLLITYRLIKQQSSSYLYLLPFSVYTGWVSVATIANISYTLEYYNWQAFGLSDQTWGILLLLIATVIAIIFTIREKDFIYPLVFIWAFIGIAVNNYDQYPMIVTVSISLSIVIFLNTMIQLISYVRNGARRINWLK
ncbi:TspO/MBR family protein [Cytobacillus horneckiae]|uniref:TspO/MBR family protein n=1 Tax=Cytobacillus horneckiae TaxID=549687 RepID=UPI0039A012E2